MPMAKRRDNHCVRKSGRGRAATEPPRPQRWIEFFSVNVDEIGAVKIRTIEEHLNVRRNLIADRKRARFFLGRKDERARCRDEVENEALQTVGVETRAFLREHRVQGLGCARMQARMETISDSALPGF